MVKSRYIKKSQNDINEIFIANRFISKSIEDAYVIIKEFNSLTEKQRIDIRKDFDKREKILKNKIQNKNEDMLLTCIMVDLNIIAAIYNVNPATICMCIQKICRDNEKIVFIK